MAGKDKDEAPVCPGAAIGMTLSITFEGMGTVKSTLIGMEYGHYLIVKLPPMPDLPAKLYQKNHLVLRYFHGGNVYGFRSTLIGLIKDPVRLCILAYPEIIESLNVRHDERYVCLIQARVHITSESGALIELPGFITDISYGGCGFECSDFVAISHAALAIDDIVDLSFRFPNEETWWTLRTEVRMYKADQNKCRIGLRFNPDLSKASQHNTISLIQNFIDSLRP